MIGVVKRITCVCDTDRLPTVSPGSNYIHACPYDIGHANYVNC